MAVAGTNVSNFDGLNFTLYVGHGVVLTAGAQTQAHGISDFVPDVAIVIQTTGDDGMGATGTAMTAITAQAVDATNVTWTNSVAGGIATVICF